MRRTLAMAALLLAATGTPASSRPVVGGLPGGIFEFGAGGRALGMGGAYTAMVDLRWSKPSSTAK